MSGIVLNAFPQALPNDELVFKVSKSLNEFGFDADSTLLATSLCCDEVNRPLEKDLRKAFGGRNFSMGGLSGFPFGGITSFGAMAHHIPKGGSCLVVFGPHVGIDSEGNIGVVNRRGRSTPGACCGSACAALHHFQSGHGKPAPEAFADPADYQQAMVVKLLEPHAKTLTKASEPMKELPHCLFQAMQKVMEQIVAIACQEVHGGKIALLGGIQINTPSHMSDFFLPLTFDVRSNQNIKIADLLSFPELSTPTLTAFSNASGVLTSTPESAAVMDKLVKKAFPKAVTNAGLVAKVATNLQDHGFTQEGTLLATSLCCDEVCRNLEFDLRTKYDSNFSMGGLAGFAFGGVTSFGAMAHHIPKDGNCLIVYGPHVGIDAEGNVGVVNRRGRSAPSTCCGSACAALKHLQTECPLPSLEELCDPAVSQQAMVVKMLEPYSKALANMGTPMKHLPMCLFEAQQKLMDQIVEAGCQQVHGGKIALLGGIQINTPYSEEDYFFPLTFEVRNNANEKIADLCEC